MQCFGTPWTLKALHPASSCPTSSAGGYFHHTVAVSYWAHSTGASQRHNRLAPIIPSYSSPQWKIQATLSCALSSSEQSKWHKIAQEICSSWQAAPEPATAAGTSWVPGNSWQGEGNWGQRDQKQVPDHNLHLWRLPVVKASLYCSTCFMGSKDQGAVTGWVTILSLASAQDRAKLLCYWNFLHFSGQQSKPKD